MSKGLCFLFRESFHADDIRVLISSDRFLLCTVKVGVEYFVFGNIYAPNNDKEKKIFFNNISNSIKEKLNEQQKQKLILMGDFNCVLDNSKDIVSGLPHSHDTVKDFNNFVEKNNLFDLWRKHSGLLVCTPVVFLPPTYPLFLWQRQSNIL